MLDGWSEANGYVPERANGSAGASLRDGLSPDASGGFLQRSLKSAIHCNGVGVHSGKPISLTLHPAPANHGVIFRRTDLKNGARDIPARFDRVIDTRMCTTIANDHGAHISTVEHVMAALAGYGIDNALIEIDGPEVPVMDGSSEPFIFLIDCAGVEDLPVERQVIVPTKRIAVEDGGATAELVPSDRPTLHVAIDFDNDYIGRQELFLEVTPENFKRELCRARTFGFRKDAEYLWSKGLALGASLENTVVIDGEKVLNEDGLRYEDEFVRHKTLDCIGDMALAEAPIFAHFRGYRSGHGLNNRLLRALFADKDNWTKMPISEARALAGVLEV